MDSNEAIHELARRARVERSLYIAEALAEVIFDIHQFIKRQFAGPDAGRRAKPAHRVPAHQR
jgi:predicted transcriptional regulator